MLEQSVVSTDDTATLTEEYVPLISVDVDNSDGSCVSQPNPAGGTSGGRGSEKIVKGGIVFGGEVEVSKKAKSQREFSGS